MKTHPARLTLDRWLGSEIHGEAERDLALHVEECERCRSYVERFRRDRENLFRSKDPAIFARRAYAAAFEQDAPRKTFRRQWSWVGAAAAAAVVVLAVLFVSSQQASQTTDTPPVTWRGSSATVQAFVWRGEGRSRVSLDELRVGDRVQLHVEVPPDHVGFAAAIGIEGSEVVPLLPDDLEADAFSVRQRLLLPGSIRLEPGSGEVRLLVVVRTEPFRVGDLISEANALGNLLDTLPGLAADTIIDLGETP